MVWNVMKVISLGLDGYIAERAGVEVVDDLGGATLVLSGLVGIVTLRAERLVQAGPARA